MAKKNLKYYVPGAIALLLGIAAFCMMFLNAVEMSVTGGGITWESGDTYTGAQLAFGYSEELPLLGEVTVLNFNIFTFLGFALPLIGGVLALLFKNGFLSKIITTACFVVGAVFLFCIVAMMPVGLPESSKESFNAEYWKLGIGPIIGGILSVLGAVVCFFKGTIAKMVG